MTQSGSQKRGKMFLENFCQDKSVALTQDTEKALCEKRRMFWGVYPRGPVNNGGSMVGENENICSSNIAVSDAGLMHGAVVFS